jgi:uncharacterized membrane protein
MPVIQRIATYFFRGLLVVAPAGLTLYILYTSFVWVDGLLAIERRYGIRAPGLGALVVIGGVTLVGFLASGIAARYVLALTEGLFRRLPLVRLIYTSIRDLLEAFVGDRWLFGEPVMVAPFAGGEAKVLGFVTRTDLDRLGMKGHVAVYLPQAYNFAGQLVVVPKDRTTPIGAEGADVMAFIVSGGVSGEAGRKAGW